MQFHLTIAQASANRYFHDILSHLGTNIIPRSRINSARLAQDDPANYMDRVSREHEDIFDAISRQDADSARAAMRTHLGNSRERLRRAQELIEAGRPSGDIAQVCAATVAGGLGVSRSDSCS